MRKENSAVTSNATVVAVNVIILAILMAKTCKPIFNELADLVTQFSEIKKKEKVVKNELQKYEKMHKGRMPESEVSSKLKNQELQFKESKLEIIEKTQTVIGPLSPLVEQSIRSFTLDEIRDNILVSQNVRNYIMEKVKELEKMEIVPYESQSILAVASPVQMIKENAIDSFLSVSSINEVVDVKANTLSNRFNRMNLICNMAVAIILLHTFGMNIEKIESFDTMIIEDMEDFLETSVLEESFEDKPTDYKTQFNEILSQEGISLDDKLDKIISSKITSIDNVFDFVFEIENTELKLYDKMEKIIKCPNATFEEKFHFISKREELTTSQKIWYTLLIPNFSFEKTYLYLLTIDEVSEEEVIENIIHADIIPFTTLFNTLLKQDNLNIENFAYYISIYNANYNSVTLEEKFSYILRIQQFDEEEKIDCIWELLKGDLLNNVVPDSCGLTECEKFILDFYGMTFSDYLDLYNVSIENQTSDQRMVFQLFERILDTKIQYILDHYAFMSMEQLIDVLGGVAAEGANNYYDLYWVSNVLFNRITDSKYVKKGINPYDQFIAKAQFSVYANGSYKLYIDATHPDYTKKYNLAKLAFCNMFYAAYDGIEHGYLEFRSSGTVEFSDNRAMDYENNCIVVKGNRYGGRILNEDLRIQYEYLYKGEKVEFDEQNILKREILAILK